MSGASRRRLLGQPDVARYIPTPLADAWAAAVTGAGGTYSANTLAAQRALERDLFIAGLTAKLIKVNTECGSDIIAAKRPLIAVNGNNPDTTTGTYASWVEANGLVGVSMPVLDTGVVPSTCGISASAASMGVYLLDDVATSGIVLMGDAAGPTGPFQLFANNGSRIVFDTFKTSAGGRTQSVSTVGGTLTKGMTCGSRWDADNAGVFRNGALYGLGGTANVSDGITSNTIKLYGARGISAGYFIGLGLTPDDIANITWIFHKFNVALGRGVVAEGLY